jgi:ribonuclease BN (tRNA processing enzyme)
MRPSLLPHLVNGPFEDPALFIRFLFENRAIMFDLGDINALSTRDILKLTHVFVTHTHMDHFAGFDRLLRIFLGREKQLHLFGPRGFIRNVEGKLGGYQWNLAENFTNRFSIKVTEIRSDQLLTMTYRCQNRFQPDTDILYSPDNLDKIVVFANGSDQFYVETAFLEADAHIAAQKYHLTAKQAGEIAGLAGAKKIIPFHFSPRYSDDAQRLETEALTAFNRIRNKIEY